MRFRFHFVALALFFLLLPPFIQAQVAVSIKPVHSLTVNLLQNTTVTSRLIVEGDDSPHTLILKPSVVSQIRSAKLLVFVNEDKLETFIARLLPSLPTEVNTLRLTDTPVELLPLTEGDHHEDEHDNDHRHKKHDQEENESAGHDMHEHTGFDPHIWLSPDNGKVIAKSIAESLIRIFPEHAATVKTNLARLTDDLTALDRRVANRLSNVQVKPFLVYHDAYRYFTEKYNLPHTGALYVDPNVLMSAKRLADIKQTVAQKNVACLFFEPQFRGTQNDRLSSVLGLPDFEIDPLGTSVTAGTQAYNNTIMQITDALIGCFSK